MGESGNGAEIYEVSQFSRQPKVLQGTSSLEGMKLVATIIRTSGCLTTDAYKYLIPFAFSIR